MGAGQIAGGYHGPPALTPARALTSWTLDLPALVVLLLAAGLYLGGVRRARRAGESWSGWWTASFLAGGAGVLVIATMSFIGVYQNVLFSIRGVQTVLLLLVAPLFLALGRPLSLAAAALPGFGRRADAALCSRAARVVTFPAVTALALVIVPFLFYFTAWYEAGLDSGLARELTHVALLAPGLVFFWTLLRVDRVPKAYPYVVSLWVTAAEVIGDAILGLAVIADQSLIAGGYYHALGRPWGPGLRADQVLGGGALWILGDIVGLPFLAAQLIQMIREDERDAAVIDAELDARDAARAASGDAGGRPAAPDALEGAALGGMAPSRPGTNGTGADEMAADGVLAASPGRGDHGGSRDGRESPQLDRPWWESDPRFTGRFRPPAGG